MDSRQAISNAAAYYIIVCGEYLKNYVYGIDDKESNPPKRRRFWMDTFYKNRNRNNETNLWNNLIVDPSQELENFCRMSAEDFEYILNKIGPSISKMNTNMRECIPIKDRLAVTLRFLASGVSFKCLSCLFKFSPQTVSRCVDDVCKALIQELDDEIKLPQNSETWLNIANEFFDKWNFPHCVGAIDGRHIVIQSPNKNESEAFNGQETFSIVFMALVDANYNFIFVDARSQGRISDGSAFKNTVLWNKLENDQLMLPADEHLLSRTNNMVPYVFLGHDAFALNRYMMKPYTGIYEKGSKRRVFNCRLTRAQRVAENVFGRMSSVFRVLRRPILLNPEKVTNITMACALLHNFLKKSKTSSSKYCPKGTFDTGKEGDIIPGYWREDHNNEASFLPIRKVPHRSVRNAKEVRELFTEYFITNGAVSWQNNC